MAKEQEESFRKEAGRWTIAGGIVAGIIGLVTNPNITIAAAGVVLGGILLRRD